MNSQNREDLPCLQLDVVELGDEHGGHALEDGRAVHVHGGPDGENEPADPLVYTVVFFDTLHHGGKGGGAGNGETTDSENSASKGNVSLGSGPGTDSKPDSLHLPAVLFTGMHQFQTSQQPRFTLWDTRLSEEQRTVDSMMCISSPPKT